MPRRGKNKSLNLVKNDKQRGKGRRRRRKRKGGRFGVYGAAASQLSRDVRYLMSVINVEDKYVDNNAGPVTLSGAWQSTLLNALAQGNTSSQRQGQSVKVIGVELRYVLYNSAAGGAVTTRVILLRDKQCNAAAPTLTNVYPVDITSPRVVGYLDRFVLDVEDVVTLNNTGTSSVHRTHVFRTNWHIDFNSGNAGTVADIVTNSYYIGYVCDATVNFPTITWTARIVFVDN